MSKDLVPQNFKDRMTYCEILANSSMVPTNFRGKKEDIFTAVEFGLMVGLNPMQALTNIAVINGRPSIWGDAALALVKASGRLEYIKEYIKGDGENLTAVCEVKRKDEPVAVIREFSVQDAKRAGLWGNKSKSPWINYPKRMLQLRARAWSLRDTFPDILNGLQIAEEVQDIEDANPNDTVSTIEAEIVQPNLRKELSNYLQDHSIPVQSQKAFADFAKDAGFDISSDEIKTKLLEDKALLDKLIDEFVDASLVA